MAMNDFIRAYSDFSAIFLGKVDQPVTEWAMENIKLPPGEAYKNSSKVSYDDHPHIPAILETMRDPDIREVILCLSSQTGKTLGLAAILAYGLGPRRVNAMYVAPSEELRKRIYSRLRSILSSSPSIRLDEDAKGGSTNEMLKTRAGTKAIMALASSPASLASDGLDLVLADEVDEVTNFKQGLSPWSLVRSRVRTRPSSKIIFSSTPKLLEGGIISMLRDPETRQMERRIWCHHCNEFFWPCLEVLRYPENIAGTKILESHLAWWECPHCHGKTFDSEHHAATMHGQWFTLNPEASKFRVGFHANAACTIFLTPSKLAHKYIEAKDDPNQLRDIYNSDLAMPVDDSVTTRAGELQSTALDPQIIRGNVPEWAEAIMIGVDIGVSKLFVVILAIGPGNRKAVVNDYIHSWTHPEDVWAHVDRHYAEMCESIPDSIYGVGCAMDTGYRATDWYQGISERLWCFAVKGFETLTKPWIKNAVTAARARGGQVELYSLHQDTTQDALQTALELPLGMPGSLSLPWDSGKLFLAHLDGEVRRRKLSKHGYEKFGWASRTSTSKWDLRDALRYAHAMSKILGWHAIPVPEVVTNPTPRPSTPPAFNSKRLGSSRC